jgi:hypothetical protein
MAGRYSFYKCCCRFALLRASCLLSKPEHTAPSCLCSSRRRASSLSFCAARVRAESRSLVHLVPRTASERRRLEAARGGITSRSLVEPGHAGLAGFRVAVSPLERHHEEDRVAAKPHRLAPVLVAVSTGQMLSVALPVSGEHAPHTNGLLVLFSSFRSVS